MAKKRSLVNDFKLKHLEIEIGRSKKLKQNSIIVYQRKIKYNLRKEYWDILKKNPRKVHDFMCTCDINKYCYVPYDDFIFVYFNHKLDKCAIFTYTDLLLSELKQKPTNEYFYKVKVDKLYTLKELQNILNEKIGFKKFQIKSKDLDMGIVDRDEAKILRKNGKGKEDLYEEPIY